MSWPLSRLALSRFSALEKGQESDVVGGRRLEVRGRALGSDLDSMMVVLCVCLDGCWVRSGVGTDV